jgi:cytochrome c oxidase assembly factor CtaG
VGVVHGLAGSGALTALVMASLPTLSSQVAYILVFGAGSAIGMAALSACAGGALAWLLDQRRVIVGLSWASGALSVAYGVWTGSPFLWHALVR